LGTIFTGLLFCSFLFPIFFFVITVSACFAGSSVTFPLSFLSSFVCIGCVLGFVPEAIVSLEGIGVILLHVVEIFSSFSDLQKNSVFVLLNFNISFISFYLLLCIYI